jgi:hypothetical protein
VQNHFQQVQVGVGDRLEEVTRVDRKPFGQSKFRRFAPRTLDGVREIKYLAVRRGVACINPRTKSPSAPPISTTRQRSRIANC